MNNDAPDISFTLIDINLNGYNGYYVEFDGKGFFIDYSKLSKGIEVFDVARINRYYSIPFEQNNTTIPDFNSELYLFQKNIDNIEAHLKSEWRYWLCSAGCTAISAAIAAADGSAPIMDILAVAHQGDCVMGCADKHL